MSVVDSSGKIPAAFLDGTVTSPGDYDECIGIKGQDDGDIYGKYCMVDMFPHGYEQDKRRTDGKVSLSSMRHFTQSAYYFGLCFPNACSPSDVRGLVKEVLKPYPLLIEGDLHCDTKESISWQSQFKKIRIGPLVSL